MKRREVLAAAGVAVMLAGCGSDTYSWNQNLAITVQTPAGEKSGFAISRVTIHVGDGGLTGYVMNQSIAGEATMVDFGGGKYLFALLSESGTWEAMTANLAEFTFRDKVPAPVIGKSDRQNLGAKYGILQELREKRTVPSGSRPLLVTFGNINDPASVKEVKPGDLAATFGQGYRLSSITLEITDEAVTEGTMQKLLPWLPNFYDTHLDGNKIETIRANNRLANSLASGNFSTWR